MHYLNINHAKTYGNERPFLLQLKSDFFFLELDAIIARQTSSSDRKPSDYSEDSHEPLQHTILFISMYF